jgi:hypothetical protein
MAKQAGSRKILDAVTGRGCMWSPRRVCDLDVVHVVAAAAPSPGARQKKMVAFLRIRRQGGGRAPGHGDGGVVLRFGEAAEWAGGGTRSGVTGIRVC